MPSQAYDVLIVGGGPAGSTAALVLARAGKRVLIIEKANFPRFHIGESFLPFGFQLLRELGLESALKAIPHVPKFGAEFAMGDDFNTQLFDFSTALCLADPETFNIDRSLFDAMLLDAAQQAGAQVRQATVKHIHQLEDERVSLRLDDDEEVHGRYLLDASGQSTLVARHRDTRHTFTDPHLQKVAYFAHLNNVQRHPGIYGGYPCIVMAEEGWFWLIPLNERTMSVGLVIDSAIARSTGVPPSQMLRWAIERCPVVRQRCANATIPPTNQVLSNFSYTCRPYAGAGHFLIGDAAAFLDPIFSTGATLAMASGKKAAELLIEVLDRRMVPPVARSAYVRYFSSSARSFWNLIRGYYQHSFRELFMNGTGPFQIHRAVLGVLAGNVFPEPPFPMRWRLAMFHACVRINRYLPLVPRRHRFSLLEQSPNDLSQAPAPPLPQATLAAFPMSRGSGVRE